MPNKKAKNEELKATEEVEVDGPVSVDDYHERTGTDGISKGPEGRSTFASRAAARNKAVEDGTGK